MTENREPQTETAAERTRIPWNEYRLLFYSALIGVAGGLGAQLFVWILNFTERLLLVGIAGYQPPEPGSLNPQPIVGSWGLWLIPLVTTLGGLLSGILVYTFAPEAEGHGTDAAVEAFHFKGGRVRPIVPLIKVFASAITIGSGGAAGREGPTAQISVGVGSMLADLLRLPDEERRVLVLAGMAAGLAAIFRSPLGMAIFSVEILYSGMAFETEALIYTVVASVVAYAVNGLFVGWSPIFLFPETVHFTQPIALVGYAILGVVAGIVGAIEAPIFYGIRDLFRALKIPNHVKPAIGGLLMGLLALVVPETISTGYGWVQKAMTGDYIGWSLIFLALAKILAMSLTISSGGSGGVFGPNEHRRLRGRRHGCRIRWHCTDSNRHVNHGRRDDRRLRTDRSVDARDHNRLCRRTNDIDRLQISSAIRGAGRAKIRFTYPPGKYAPGNLRGARAWSSCGSQKCHVATFSLFAAPRHARSHSWRARYLDDGKFAGRLKVRWP